MRAATMVLVWALVAAAPASARNIVLTNDDGLSANVKALYDDLKARGHDVIVSLPCTNQSGMGAAIRFMQPLGPLKADCRNGAARAGDPGAGPMTKPGHERDFFYVDGTPVMAMLYGIDVAAAARWGHAPDLVLSGPNEGQNVGAIVLTSGTVSNAQVAGTRGIPAIALSAGAGTSGDQFAAGSSSQTVARLTSELLDALSAGAKGGPLLPPGILLNVNFPDRLEGARWRITRIGSYNGLKVRFAADLAATVAIGGGRRPTPPHLPGVTVEPNQSPAGADQRNDESAVNKRDISVSPMRVGYDPDANPSRNWLAHRLRGLTSPSPRVHRRR